MSMQSQPFQNVRLCPGPADSNVREYKDDSAKGLDPEKADKASTGGSSRGSAQFLSEVEGQRAIKVSDVADMQEACPLYVLWHVE